MTKLIKQLLLLSSTALLIFLNLVTLHSKAKQYEPLLHGQAFINYLLPHLQAYHHVEQNNYQHILTLARHYHQQHTLNIRDYQTLDSTFKTNYLFDVKNNRDWRKLLNFFQPIKAHVLLEKIKTITHNGQRPLYIKLSREGHSYCYRTWRSYCGMPLYDYKTNAPYKLLGFGTRVRQQDLVAYMINLP